MNPHDDDLPDDLRPMAARLRDERTEPTGIELARAKLRARSRARQGRQRIGVPVRARLLTTVLVFGLMAAGTGGLLAATNGGQAGPQPAAKAQYCPEGKAGDQCRKDVDQCKK